MRSNIELSCAAESALHKRMTRAQRDQTSQSPRRQLQRFVRLCRMQCQQKAKLLGSFQFNLRPARGQFGYLP
jgi:hypothetical protein